MRKPGVIELLPWVLLSAVACRSPPALELEYEGCLYVLGPAQYPTCVLDAGKPSLRVWARSSAGAQIEIEAGDQRWLAVEGEAIQGGTLFRLEDLDADELVARTGSWGSRSQRTLLLSKRAPPPDREESVAQLEARLDAGVPDEERGFILDALADLAIEDKDPAASRKHLDEAARAHAAAGQISNEIATLTRLHFLLYDKLDELEEAGEILSRLPRPAVGDGLSFFYTSFYRGAWSNRFSRPRDALRELEAARRQAERLAIEKEYFADLERVHLLSRLGRYAEARELIEQLRPTADLLAENPCGRAKLFNNIGWSELLMREAGRPVDPVPSLSQALAAARACEDQEPIRNVEINLTLAHLYRGDLEKAREHFAAVMSGEHVPPWWIRVWSLDVEARIALAEGDPETALALYRELAEGSQASFDMDAEWRAAIGQGQALAALGRPEEALAAYGEADAKVWEASLAVPLGQGRQSSMQLYQRGTRLHLELLARLGRKQEALEVVRKSRARVLHGLVVDQRLADLKDGEKGQWERLVTRYRSLKERIEEKMREEDEAAADRGRQLREERARLESDLDGVFNQALSLLDAGEPTDLADLPLRSGELTLVYHRLDRGWLGFAVSPLGVEMQRLAELAPDALQTPAELSASLLEPFAESIQRAEKIRILPYGELSGVHFHALPFAGGLLLETAPVVYSLDLPPPARVSGPALDVLLISDPTRSLAGASSEVASVERQLESGGTPWRTRLLAPPEATIGAVRKQLDTALALFHFAGHGDLVGWGGESGLVFERGFDGKVLLTIRDILTLRHPPETVVLSGCETVRPAMLEAPASLGTAHAFLLAGSRYALGALDKVDDHQAEELFRRFYRGWTGPGSEADALRQAQLEMAREGGRGWQSFRVLER